MQTRSVARELALLIIGQISDDYSFAKQDISIESLLNKALDSLIDYWREALDNCASQLEIAQQQLLDSELQDSGKDSIDKVRGHLSKCLLESENVLNSLSVSLDLPRLIALSNQDEVRLGAIQRVKFAIQQRQEIDSQLDEAMEGWRLKRLPKIDRDILRLAVVDLYNLDTPAAVTCNEAVNLANRYSDEQGRRMINGVLRNLQNSPIKFN